MSSYAPSESKFSHNDIIPDDNVISRTVKKQTFNEQNGVIKKPLEPLNQFVSHNTTKIYESRGIESISTET